MKILVVDDEVASRTKLQTIMETIGECVAVKSGQVAMAAFKEAQEKGAPFDLVTLDIDMPEMDGTETLYNIREIEKEMNVPEQKQAKILMVTSHSGKDTVITSIQAGCNDYLVKPFKKEVITEKLMKLGFKDVGFVRYWGRT
jgi:two-component system chemotaxis response regulator CheY